MTCCCASKMHCELLPAPRPPLPQTGSGCSCAPSTCACSSPTLAPMPPARPPSLPRRAWAGRACERHGTGDQLLRCHLGGGGGDPALGRPQPPQPGPTRITLLFPLSIGPARFWRWRTLFRTRPAGGACACWPTCPSPPPSSCARSNWRVSPPCCSLRCRAPCTVLGGPLCFVLCAALRLQLERVSQWRIWPEPDPCPSTSRPALADSPAGRSPAPPPALPPGLLPPEALAPFAEELAAREKKRAQRAKQEARRLKAERAAAAAAAAAAANTGLSAAELRAMPLPAASLLPSGLDQAAVEDAAAGAAVAEGEAGSPPDGPPPTPPQRGVSFAAIARDGFAATGPTLGSSAGSAASPTAAAAPRGVWGPRPAAPAAAPAWGPPAAGAGGHGDAAAAGLAGLQLGSAAPAAGGKGKGKKVVLFGGPQRKY